MGFETHLSIILPIYNPPINWSEKLEKSITKINLIFIGINVKIILVNDGSSIDISNEIKALETKFINLKYISYPQNKGKGFAIKFGLQNCQSQSYIYTDWDFPFGEKAILNTHTNLINNQKDLIIGVRSKAYYSSLPPVRKVISKSLKFANFVFLKFRKVDTQAGLKGLNNTAKDLFLKNKTDGFIYELEFIRACFRKKLNIGYLSIDPRNDIKYSNFSAKTIVKELKSYLKLMVS